jgi:hypothetical protein
MRTWKNELAWWCIPVISAFRKAYEFEASLGYTVSPYLKK